MSHDNDITRVFEQLAHGFRKKAGFDTRLKGIKLRLSAIKGIIDSIFDNCLVPATTKRKLERLVRAFVGLGKIIRNTYSDGKRYADIRAGIDLTRGLKERKLSFL